MKSVVSEIRRELKQAGSRAGRETAQRFFKEPIKAYGCRTADVRRIGKGAFKEVKGLSRKEVFALCEELMASGYVEEFGVAADWSYAMRKSFQPSDFRIFEKWVRKYVDNWAKCDTLCNHTIGDLIERYPKSIAKLKVWAKSKNRWIRRAAAVTLIIPARKGMFLEDVFEIADVLLMDADDMVQKGYGWMLKEASRKHQKEVFEFVMARRDRMPRTALRYAIEKMPERMRKRAMAERGWPVAGSQ